MIILSIPALLVDAYAQYGTARAFHELATEKLVVSVQPGSGIDPSNVVSASYTVDESSQPAAPVSRDIQTEGQTAQGGWGTPQETTPQTPQTEAAEMTEASQTTEAPQTGAWTAPEADATPAQEAQRTIRAKVAGGCTGGEGRGKGRQRRSALSGRGTQI